MRPVCCGLMIGLAMMIVLFGSSLADERMKTFTFESVHSINAQTISGNIRICPGNGSKFIVELKNDLEEPVLLSPEVESDHGELSIAERFTGNTVRGETFWTVYVPPADSLQRLECHSASGNMSMQKLRVNFIKIVSASGNVLMDSVHTKEFALSTASGSIDLKGGEADFIQAQSASGEITITSVSAKEVELSTASGSIMVEDGKIDEQGKMTSASGDIVLHLPHLPSDRLEAASASSDVILKVPEFGVNFSMTLMKRADKGRIRCPFEYTEKATIRYHEMDDYLTDRFIVKRGKGGPEIKLVTASGTIKIETDIK